MNQPKHGTLDPDGKPVLYTSGFPFPAGQLTPDISPLEASLREANGLPRIMEGDVVVLREPDQTDLGVSDDRPLGPDHIIYRGG